MNRFSLDQNLHEEFFDRFSELKEGAAHRFDTITGIHENEKKIISDWTIDDAKKTLNEIKEGRVVDISTVQELIILLFGRPAYFVQHDSFNTENTPSTSQDVDGLVNNARIVIEKAIPSVGRINLFRNSRKWFGTGWVVAKNILVTNRHVASEFAARDGDAFVFIRELGKTLKVELDTAKEHNVDRGKFYRLDQVLWMAPPTGQHDVAFLSIAEEPGDDQLSSIDLMKRLPDNELINRWITVIGYPGLSDEDDYNIFDQQRIFDGIYDVKRIQPGKIKAIPGELGIIKHDATTLSGNSGSVVLDLESGKALALHFGGILGENRANTAIAAPVVAELLERHVLNPINPITFPSTRHTEVQQENAVTSSDGSTATWDIPLKVSVTVGTPAMISPAQSASGHPKDSASVEEGLLFGQKPEISLEDLRKMFSLSSLAEPQFNWDTALSLAAASELVYKKRDIVGDVTERSWGLTKCNFINVHETQCFIATQDERALIAFRGSESLGDWLADLNFFPVQKKYGEVNVEVHRGFYNAFVDVQEELEQKIQELSPKEIILTGHSLGGALAILAAAEWAEKHPVSIVYTFGQPAVGKKDFFDFFTTRYTDKLFRFVNDDDIVTRVPPGYNHLEKLYHLNARGDLKSVTEAVSSGSEEMMMSETEFDSFRNKLIMEKTRLSSPVVTESLNVPILEGFLPSISDHSLSNYINKIKKKS